MRVESRIDLLKLAKAEKEEAGAGEQQAGKRDFSDDERAAQSLFFNRRGGVASAFMQIKRLVLAQKAKRGPDPGNKRGEESGACGECKDRWVHVDFVPFGEAVGYQPEQDAAKDWSGGDADESGSPGKKHGFGEQLADDG